LTLASRRPRALGFLGPHDPAAIAIVVAAAALRLGDLGRRSLWFDEAWAAIACLDGPFDVAHVRTTPLGFCALVRLSVATLGRSDFVVRLPAALLSAGTVALAYVVGRELLGRAGGRFAAVIVAFCPIPVYYGKEFKFYAGELLLTLAVAWLAGRLRRTPAWTAGWIGLALSVALGAGLTPLAPLLVAGAFIALLAVAPAEPVRYGACALASGVAAVAWLRLVFIQQLAGDPDVAAYWHLFYLPHGPPAALAAALARSAAEAATFGLGQTTPHNVDSVYRMAVLPPAATVMVTGAMLFGAVHLVRRGGGWFVVLTLAWHLLTAAAALAGRYPYGPARIALFFVAPTAILLAAAADGIAAAVPARVRPVAWLVVSLPLLWPLAGTWRENVVEPVSHEELRPLLHTVFARMRPTDAVWVSAGATPAFQFYVSHPDPRFTLSPPPNFTTLLHASIAAAAERGRGRVWLLFTHRGFEQERSALAVAAPLRVVDRVAAPGAVADLLATP
jgi:4-amino-4-deoxy-L-arabinose transferase-like glycosyltransferase